MLKTVWRKLNRISNSKLYIFVRFCIRVIITRLIYLLWIFEPFIKIRIYRGEIGRIGHLATYFEVLIRSKEVDLNNKKQFNIFIVPKNPANQTLYKMWKKHLYFIESKKLDFIFHLCAPWLSKRKHFGPLKIQQGGIPKKKPTLKFTKQENKKGISTLKGMGINNDWYVCLHSRSSDYLKNRFIDLDYSRHDLRDSSFQMLKESAKLIINKGGKCIRMSNGDNQKLNGKLREYIIDYAYYEQSDFMDVYLPANCKFFLGGPSGLLSVSHLFNTPVACTNIWPLSTVSVPANSLFIPKLLWLLDEKRFISYKEIKENKLDSIKTANEFLSKGIKVIENDNDDIKLLTLDMFDLINNNKLSKNELSVRNKFMNNYFKVNKFENKYNIGEGLKNSGNISWRFLNKHSYLMNS